MTYPKHINDRMHKFMASGEDVIVPVTFTKMTAIQKPFNITQGGLNKLRLRPQVLNESCESSRTVQSVITPTNIVGQIFKASQDNINSIYLTLESADVTSVDDFESYADSAALQLAWVATGAVALLETTVVSQGTQSMEMPSAAAGDEWAKTIPSSDFSGYTGAFAWRQTTGYATLKGRVFIGDGTNTKSAPIPVNNANNWEQFDIDIGSMTEDGGGITDETAIIAVGFRVESKVAGSSFYVDDITSTPLPGSVNIKLWDMGAALPTTGVTSIDDGTQYILLGDLAEVTPAASYTLALVGGVALYHIHEFVAGVALEIPTNEVLNVDNYYIIAMEYVDTEVSVYGPDPTYVTDYYANGYAFTAPDSATAITQIGTYNDCMFGIFSTADIYIQYSTAEADSVPGSRAQYYAFAEDSSMRITDVVITHGTKTPQMNQIDLSNRPMYVQKGGKFEMYFKDDYSDDVSKVWFGMQYYYAPPTVNG